MGLQPPAPAPNDQSLRQWLRLPRRTGTIVARHVSKETAPEAAPQATKPASTGEHAEASRWVVPLRI